MGSDDDKEALEAYVNREIGKRTDLVKILDLATTQWGDLLGHDVVRSTIKEMHAQNEQETIQILHQMDLFEKEVETILKEKNPVEFILNVYSTIHVGDRELGALLLATIGAQLCLNTHGLHPGLGGESGKGKSDACKAIFHLCPMKYRFKSGVSDKALVMAGILPGTVIFFDDVMGLSDELERQIKICTSDYQEGYTHTSTNMKKEGPIKVDVYNIPPRCTFWITSNHRHFDIQVLNRQLTLDVDESDEQDTRVMEKQLHDAQIGRYSLEETEDVRKCRKLIEILKDAGPVTVAIPYAGFIEWKGFKNRRNLPMFLDTIKSFAALNRFQRQVNETGALLANLDDFDQAALLWKSIEKEQVSKLGSKEMAVIQAIETAGKISFTELQKATRIPHSTLSTMLNGRPKNGERTGGLLEKMKGLQVDDIAETRCTGERDHETKKRKYYSLTDKATSLWDFIDLVTLTDRDGAQAAIDAAAVNDVQPMSVHSSQSVHMSSQVV